MTLENLRIFISYPRGGAAHTWAEAVQARLECEGARAWRDETGVREGEQSWYDRIEGELCAADLVVAIVGMDSAVCRWQQRELVTADGRGKPVVALRIDARVRMPFAIVENQPVEARPDQTATLTTLVDAIGRAASVPAPKPTHSASPTDFRPEAIPPDQRRAEIAWLEHLLHRELTDRAALYVPLEGVERSSPAAERVLKKVPIATESLFKAFGVAEAAARSIKVATYDNVLDAYRALSGRAVRRLAVLGEPGAGKTFSLQRIALADADRAIHDALAPIPLLVPLGLWTREDESLEDFIARSLGALGRYVPALITQRRAVLLIDAINEIPPGQRRHKAAQILALAHDQRLASVVVSCREKDFTDFSLPFDTLTLQPLSPPRVRDFLRRYGEAHRGMGAMDAADARFWQIAGGDSVRDAWEAWRAAGAADLFWTVDDIPRENPDVGSQTTWQQDQAWHRARFDPRSLLRLAANPYLLYIMAMLPDLPANRAQLFQGFLDVLYKREQEARADRHDRRVPYHEQWLAVLTRLAERLQRLPPADGSAAEAGARTALPRAEWPATPDQDLIDFSRDASVLELHGDDLRFTHQLLQEYLASRLLLEASSGTRPAADFWPHARWWERSGWEVVAEIAVESCGNKAAQLRLIAWLAEANPEVAADVWRHAGEPRLPNDMRSDLSARWLQRMTDPTLEPQPRARATIGRAMGRFGLDHRRGVGLRHDGLPDIDWQWISARSIAGSDGVPVHVAGFFIARYPVTNQQFQAFVEAGGYRDDRWWAGCKLRVTEPSVPKWDDPNSPRESVTEYEAKAYCNWLGSALELPVDVPTEKQWQAVRGGPDGDRFPWGNEYRLGSANCREPQGDGQDSAIGRTTAVGLYPHASSVDGVMDVVGNVAEWVVHPRPWSSDPRPLWPIGEGWDHKPGARDMAVVRYYADALRASTLGFRVCFVPECDQSHQ